VTSARKQYSLQWHRTIQDQSYEGTTSVVSAVACDVLHVWSDHARAFLQRLAVRSTPYVPSWPAACPFSRPTE
jgi:hypothetical protein